MPRFVGKNTKSGLALRSVATKGFTLIELLIVLAILGVLAVITLANFRSSQWKARDAKRKADLRQIVNALDTYLNDYGAYPGASADGKIIGCGCGVGTNICDWQSGSQRGGEFCDIKSTVYMKEIPGDPTGNPNYCYWSDGSSFKIFAKLENINDPQAKGPYICAINNTDYNFGLSSSNISL